MAYVREEDIGGSPQIVAEFQRDGGALVVIHAFGARYARSVKKNGFVTHREAAALLGVSRETIWRWTRGERGPKLLTPYEIDGVSVVSLAELRYVKTMRDGNA